MPGHPHPATARRDIGRFAGELVIDGPGVQHRAQAAGTGNPGQNQLVVDVSACAYLGQHNCVYPCTGTYTRLGNPLGPDLARRL
ncbi:hypothetical protein Ari01nite_23620 [Paractinoplanes rishiriensis]|uniref:Uncharacterized protein n=1 Tax=Paractinoplanes rishiriensis TaxID=1050105 RepID=A0A919N0B5_9ACTN|nr:hypothetical protein Ari01nite_23620 [Actinoplanes rishiriensis]